MTRQTWMLLAVAALVALPLLRGGEFGGADGQAAAHIEESNPDFTPWATPLWKPPSGEVEGLFFTLQAVLGALVIGYAIGRRHERAKAERSE
ncbi:energy-coupling factor ABC transporter substrate-binding protein [Rhodobacter sp. KR11]|jgi:cobalt/nickel transport protein|uniref:energy-coupling factor ABC transporter substrate-binding protein n=1 Tax=Rhodobacter sp. KR11 TaxID=2974588 RepID=UPI0022216B96|nr:energy-coupling factor ABC transporter substrate-binding protein [Rhodobacter sp. KR11]MCW1920361.1 energy-coupling factor ABC transporter substrate-binding protein [Rhodobacter sp. KR11]